MINYQVSSFFKTRERKVLPGTAFTQEGVVAALVRTESGIVAQPSTGADGEVFGGFAISVNVPATHSTKVADFVVPASGIVELNRLPVPGQIYVSVDGTKLTVEVGNSTPTDNTKVVMNGSALIFHADAISQVGYLQYHYELTASEAAAVTGDYLGGATASVIMDSVGCVVEGVISTDMFDASVDWSSAIHPSMGADGMLTVGGSGTVLTNVIIQSGPNGDSPTLTVEIQ